MKCSKLQSILFDYCDNMLSKEQMEYITEHIQHCKNCEKEFIRTRNLYQEMKKMTAHKAPADFLSSIHRQLDKETIFERIIKKCFIPFRIKLPIEIAGVLASVLILISILKVFSPHNQLAEQITEPVASERRFIAKNTFLPEEPKPQEAITLLAKEPTPGSFMDVDDATETKTVSKVALLEALPEKRTNKSYDADELEAEEPLGETVLSPPVVLEKGSGHLSTKKPAVFSSNSFQKKPSHQVHYAQSIERGKHEKQELTRSIDSYNYEEIREISDEPSVLEKSMYAGMHSEEFASEISASVNREQKIDFILKSSVPADFYKNLITTVQELSGEITSETFSISTEYPKFASIVLPQEQYDAFLSFLDSQDLIIVKHNELTTHTETSITIHIKIMSKEV